MNDTAMYRNLNHTGIESSNNEYFSQVSKRLANGKQSSLLLNFERRFPSPLVFDIEDKILRSNLPRASHWSIAWSDLMMTMFVLFLSMFTYQMAHQEFLRQGEPEIIGGDTTDALEIVSTDRASLPFDPIVRGLPLITAGTIKKVEPVAGEREKDNSAPAQLEKDFAPIVKPVRTNAEPGASLPETVLEPRPLMPETVFEPQPLMSERTTRPESNFQEIYRMSKGALDNNNLNTFAAIDLVPDKTMRIILTGDLLFGTGESELSGSAKTSLEKIIGFIKDTPYMINIVGHTDNIPMRSYKYASNWELSVNRATTVARFLIDEIGMNPNQFVVSGYSSYRPVVPNITAENRAKNRRVEIIVSKRLPSPLVMDPLVPDQLKAPGIYEK